LTSLAEADKLKVIELPTERRKTGVIKVAGQHLGFDDNAIVDNDTSQCGSRVRIRGGDWGERR